MGGQTDNLFSHNRGDVQVKFLGLLLLGMTGKESCALCVLCTSVVNDCLGSNHRGTENTRGGEEKNLTDSLLAAALNSRLSCGLQRRAKSFYRMFGEKRIVDRSLPRTPRERNVGPIVVHIDVNRVTKRYLATRHQI